jgi:hypothetical protein
MSVRRFFCTVKTFEHCGHHALVPRALAGT